MTRPTYEEEHAVSGLKAWSLAALLVALCYWLVSSLPAPLASLSPDELAARLRDCEGSECARVNSEIEARWKE